MPIRQQIFAMIVSAGIFLFTLEMVRRRRLREEYSVLWLCTSLVMFVLIVRYDWLVAITRFIGAGLPTSTLFLSAIIFLFLLAVQFSIKISRLDDRVKNLAQENAILRGKLESASLERKPDESHGENASHGS